jgi:hypothetical protein
MSAGLNIFMQLATLKYGFGHVYHSKSVALCSKHLPYDLVCIGVWVQWGSKEDEKRIEGKWDIAAGGKIKLLVLWHFPNLCTWHVVSVHKHVTSKIVAYNIIILLHNLKYLFGGCTVSTHPNHNVSSHWISQVIGYHCSRSFTKKGKIYIQIFTIKVGKASDDISCLN